MTVQEAIRSCEEGNFVTHINFSSYESMHMYKGKLFYEDGADLTTSNFKLENEDWAKDGWRIKFSKDKVDNDKLSKLHEKRKYRMLQGIETYEECINK